MLLHENPENWWGLFISVLVTWRITTLICYEAGPFNLFTKLRRFLYQSKIGSLIDCFHCTAVWISLFVTGGMYTTGASILYLVFAVAGGASVIEKIIYYSSTLKESENENQQ